MDKRKATLKTLIDKYGKRCRYCGKRLVGWRRIILEHFIPRSRGGSNDFHNLFLSCDGCNHLKNNLLPHEIIKRMDEGIDEYREYYDGFITTSKRYLLKMGHNPRIVVRQKKRINMLRRYRNGEVRLRRKMIKSVMEIVNDSINPQTND